MKQNILLISMAVTALLFTSTFGQAKAQTKKEFGNSARYAKQNAELGQPIKGEKRVVFLGNSIFETWGKHRPDFFKDHKYINRGISGQTTYNFLCRFQSDVINMKPKVLVLLGGTNDIAENTCAYDEDCTFNNIKSMVELAKAHKMKVILCSVVPSASFPWRKEITDAPEKIKRLNQRLVTLAQQENITYLDFFSVLVDSDGISQKKDLTFDGVHPTPQGFLKMEEIVVPAIKKNL